MFVNNYCLSMNCIIAPLDGYGGIYLGNLDAAKDSQLLTQYNIGAVLQVLDQSVPIRGAQKLWIMAEDSEEFPLNKYFEQAIKFIENQSKKTNVLVHCYAGISRSAAILAAYLMQKYDWTINQAILHLQSKRRIVNPNPGFMIQLQDFQQKLRNNNQQSTLPLAIIQNEFQNDQQNYQNSQSKISPLHKISRLDEFNNKLDQFRNQLRIKHKVC
ncbi:unnamed protein product [Paramecium octaurelia]|uniref:Uncharacterized protein n=1 Tax=Paramecium octaurelia TaxID=43137 RepID=A0A8S1WC87_PAROT|nr:unnamed protein product [Paramecium octaurelia]